MPTSTMDETCPILLIVIIVKTLMPNKFVFVPLLLENKMSIPCATTRAVIATLY